MRALIDLQASRAGRLLLEDSMIFDDPSALLACLRAPRRDTGTQGGPNNRPVYVHQQAYLDYRSSVVAKMLALRGLHDRSMDVQADFIWIDTDRAGSDKLGLRLYLPGRHGKVPIRFAPSGCDRLESRFIALDPAVVRRAMNRMKQMVHHLPGARKELLARFDILRPVLETEGSLTKLSRALSDFLFDEVLSFKPRPVLVSSLIDAGVLNDVLEKILNRQRAFVDAVNIRIRHLQSSDIAPQLKPLPDDYLPLFMPCPADGRRLRLRLEIDGATKLACATDSAGEQHSFELGRTDLSLQTLSGQVQWSPDISLPMLVNCHYSGMVAGKSSALYMMVFGPVMQRVLELDPIPVFVPSSWDVFPGQFDSLLCAYLSGNRI